MVKIHFYGTRGSMPLADQKFTEFGVGTTCILLEFGPTMIMVDCGTGVCNAIDDLKDIKELHLFISHFHNDHIAGIPWLISQFKGKKLHIWGKTWNGVCLHDAISQIMHPPIWPVSIDAFNNVEFHEITADVFIGSVKISNMDSGHPGGCSIFRFDAYDESIVTCLDICHPNGFSKELLAFADHATTLIHEGTFSDAEMSRHPEYGHSTPEAGAELGKRLGCKQVYITHFGPYDDEELHAWEALVRKKYPFVSFARSGQKTNSFKEFIEMGVFLTSQKDINELLEKTVEMMMNITGADGGTLYLLEKEYLTFKVMVTKSKGIRLLRKEEPLGIKPVCINGNNVCAAAVREKKLINIPDCYAEQNYDFSGTREYDWKIGYHTQSVLVVPMTDEYDDVIGVLQLINATDHQGRITPFLQKDERLLKVIANHAGMAIENSINSNKITDFLYGFIKVMSVGIDERTPYNANHTRNMVTFAEHFFDYEDTCHGTYKVDDKKRREILMSIWLHDIGKILTPLFIINKDNRLGHLYKDVEKRFERRELLLRLFLADGSIGKQEYDFLENERVSQIDFIKKINTIGFLSDDFKKELDRLFSSTYIELDKTRQPVITAEEYEHLSIVKGTLTTEERNIMQNHVVMTKKFLAQLNFPKYYDHIPIYAGNHHEFLDGSGYPDHLTAKDLPWPCRLITIFDIFEALVSRERPYKKPIPLDKSLEILYEMADQGKLDAELVKEFEKSKAWINT